MNERRPLLMTDAELAQWNQQEPEDDMPILAEELGLKGQLSLHLDAISKLFKSPRITLVVRSADYPDGGVVIGDDDPELAIAEIRKLYGGAGRRL